MKPVLLLIPGMFNTGAIWDPVRQFLGDSVEVRVADVLTQDSISAMAHDAWQLVADLEPRRPLVVAGFSMGGYVALELLATHPGAVHGLAMIDSAAGIETEQSMQVRHKTIGALERNFERTVEGIISFSLHPNSLRNATLIEGMRSMMHAVGAAGAIRQTRAIMARRDHRALLSKLTMPTSIICGRDDKVTPPALTEELQTLLPHAQVEWIDDAGHQTVLEQAPAVANHLTTLCQRATAAAISASFLNSNLKAHQ